MVPRARRTLSQQQSPRGQASRTAQGAGRLAASALRVGTLGICTLLASCAQPKAPNYPSPALKHASAVVIEAPSDVRRPPFVFSKEDGAFLEDVERGAFNFLWKTSDPTKDAASGGVVTGMAPDRTSKPTVSVAGVGFQLSGLCVGVERGWITRDQGAERASLILRSLANNKDNRKAGLFYHFVDAQTAGQPAEAYERVVSTVDSALLLAGVLTASQYFGGDVRTLGDQLFEDANWKFFVAGPDAKDPQIRGYITLGWKPADPKQPTAAGALLPYGWVDSGDEHRLVTFLGACAPQDAHRVDPSVYYKLRRQLGEYPGSGEVVWFPWSGALFTSIYANCWIDYAGIGLDNPQAWGVAHRARVDWWENSRRMVMMHQRKAGERAGLEMGYGVHAWGLTASDIKDGYAVPGLFPHALPMPGATEGVDLVTWPVKDDLGDGTLAPYGAGCSIMFDPLRAVAAMKHYKALNLRDRDIALWNDPARGGFGFHDAFNAKTGWVAPDCLSIDQGALLLAIENARTGLIWKHFHQHPFVQAGMERLKLTSSRPQKK